jgi:hypothetical protein
VGLFHPDAKLYLKLIQIEWYFDPAERLLLAGKQQVGGDFGSKKRRSSPLAVPGGRPRVGRVR